MLEGFGSASGAAELNKRAEQSRCDPSEPIDSALKTTAIVIGNVWVLLGAALSIFQIKLGL